MSIPTWGSTRTVFFMNLHIVSIDYENLKVRRNSFSFLGLEVVLLNVYICMFFLEQQGIITFKRSENQHIVLFK